MKDLMDYEARYVRFRTQATVRARIFSVCAVQVGPHWASPGHTYSTHFVQPATLEEC